MVNYLMKISKNTIITKLIIWSKKNDIYNER